MAAVERGMRAAGKRGVSPLHGHHPCHHFDHPGHPGHLPHLHPPHPEDVYNSFSFVILCSV